MKGEELEAAAAKSYAAIREEALHCIDAIHPELDVDDVVKCCLLAGALYQKKAQQFIASHDRLTNDQRDFVLISMSTSSLIFMSTVKCLMKNPMLDSPTLFRAQLKEHIESNLSKAKTNYGNIQI